MSARRAARRSPSRSRPATSTQPTIVSPATPVKVDESSPADVRRHGRLLRDARARRRERAVHGHGAGPGRGQRARAAERGGAARRPATDYPPEIKALYLERRRTARSGRTRTSSRHKIVAEAPSTAPYRPRRRSSSKELQSSDLQLRRPTSATSTAQRSRTVECFAHVQAGLLPVLRGDDGGASCATWASRPGSSRGSCRARATGRPATERILDQQRPRLGRGLLPGLSAGSRSTRPAATCRQVAPLPSGPPGRERRPVRRAAASGRPPRSASATSTAGGSGRRRRGRAPGRTPARAAHRGRPCSCS